MQIRVFNFEQNQFVRSMDYKLVLTKSNNKANLKRKHN